VDAHLGPGALVDQQRQPFARGQLLALVLLLDLLGAAALLDLAAALVQLLDERPEHGGRGVSCGHGLLP
jgi:hypothetical protein